MKHDWKLNEYDGGAVGRYEVSECATCTAVAGAPEMRMAPFLADGSGLRLTEDCAESQLIIAAYKLGLERGKLIAQGRLAER